jgi:hypothetical protein
MDRFKSLTLFFTCAVVDNLQRSPCTIETHDCALLKISNVISSPVFSVYGQVAAWNSHVYVLWQDSMPSDKRNYDIFIKNSANNGTTLQYSANLFDTAELMSTVGFGNTRYLDTWIPLLSPAA